LSASPEAPHAEQPLGNPPQLAVIEMHCMSALQPAVALHVFTALVQSPHLEGLQVQRSKGAASTGGGAASCGVAVVDEVEVDVPRVDVVPAGVLVDVVPPPGVVLAPVDVLVLLADVNWPLDDDGGLLATVVAVELVAPNVAVLAGSPPSAAHAAKPMASPSPPHRTAPVRFIA
jgi:hypothetical protein